MAFGRDTPVAAGLNQVAKMDRRERARIMRQVCQHYPAFLVLFKQVAVARGVAFASGLSLAVAVVLLVQSVSVWLVAGLVFAGLAGFGYVAVVLTDSRFDLLLAVLGAHRTDELHGRLVTEELYTDEPVHPSEQEVAPNPVIRSRMAPRFGPGDFTRQGRHA